jgi:hypothetical protein
MWKRLGKKIEIVVIFVVYRQQGHPSKESCQISDLINIFRSNFESGTGHKA